MTTRELKTHDSNQEKNDFMVTTPEVAGSAARPGPARPCPGKLSKGPACSAASGWGLSCEGLALHQARAEGQVAKCGTTGIRHNPALPAPRASQCFHEWSHFPDSGLAELPAARPNHHQPPPGLRVGPEQFCSCEWQRALPPLPQGEEEGKRGFIFIFIFKFPALFLRKGIVSFRILAAVPDNSCGFACGRRDWRLRSSVWKSACCF